MSRYIPAIIVCLAALLLLSPGRAEPPLQVTPVKGMVILRNGQVLRGKVTHAGDFYYVALPDGGIRLSAAEVELVCTSLVEGYLRKRSKIRPGDIRQHLALARWCL